jgi:hypothetical protein
MPNKLNKTQIESIETSQVEQLSETLADNLQAANDYTDDEINTLSGSITTALNGKEPTITAGTTSQYWRGDKSFQTLNSLAVTENTNLYFTEARVRSTVLTGFSATNSAIVAGDSVLTAFNKTQGQINQRVSLTGNETIAGEKTFSSNPISSATQSTAINSLTRRDFVTGLDSQNVKITGDQTIAGNKTFNNPVTGVAPTSGSHLTTRDFVDPANLIYSQVQTVISRYASATLNFPAWKIYALEELYRKLIRETKQNTLPVFFIDPELSADTSNSSATTLINLGTTGSTITTTNSDIGTTVVNNEFVFSGTNYLTSNTSQNGGGLGYTTAVNINRASAGTMRIISSTTIFPSYDTLHVAVGSYRSRTYDTNDGNGIGRDTTNFTVSTDRKYITTYNGNNLNSGIKIFTNGVQTDTADGNIGTFATSRNTGAGNIQVGAKVTGQDIFSGVMRRILVFHGTAFSQAQITGLNNLI